jgi:MFS family permease
MFYVYTPIFAVTSGLGAETGGIVESIGTGWIWLVPFWGWVGRRFGLRRLLQAGYAVAGVLSICAALAFGTPWLGAGMLVLAALGTEIIDGAGNLLFLRAVRAYERSEMTTVFVSFRDVAQLGPPAVCSLLLSLFSLSSVFIASGLMMIAASSLAAASPPTVTLWRRCSRVLGHDVVPQIAAAVRGEATDDTGVTLWSSVIGRVPGSLQFHITTASILSGFGG